MTSSQDHTLDANGPQATYTVTFDAAGGSVGVPNKCVTFDAEYGELPVPERYGYTFVTWQAETNGVCFSVGATNRVCVAGDHVLTAVWEANTYEITLDYQGGGGGSINAHVTFCACYPDLCVPGRYGYTFEGWWTAPNGEGTRVTSATVVTNASSHTLYAKWSVILCHFRYRAGPHGRVVGDCDQTVYAWESGSGVTAVPDPGYRFLSWSDGCPSELRYDPWFPGWIWIGFFIRNLDVTADFGGVAFRYSRLSVNEGQGAISLAIEGVPQTSPYSVEVTVLPGSAGPKDYEGPLGGTTRVYWQAGDSEPKRLRIPIRQDRQAEGDETFFVLLGNPSGCGLSGSCVCPVTITDDDIGAVRDKGVHVAGLPQPPEGGRIVGGAYCETNRTVKLTARPSKGWAFIGWDNGELSPTRTISGSQAAGQAVDGQYTVQGSFKRTKELARPVASNPGTQRGTVGVTFSMDLPVESECMPTIFIRGLPAGLRYDASGKRIVGTPVQAGTYSVRFVASNPAGAAPAQTFAIEVDNLPEWALGTFNGEVRDAAKGSGTALMTVTSQGGVSGKLMLGGTTFRFAAKTFAERGDAGELSLSTTAWTGKASVPLSLVIKRSEIMPAAGLAPNGLAKVAGTLGSEGTVTLYHNVWGEPELHAALSNDWAGYYTCVLPGGGEYGSGYLALTLDRFGRVKIAGRLGDGTPLVLQSQLVLDESARLYAVLYSSPPTYMGGALFGAVEFYKAAAGARAKVRTLEDEPLSWRSRNPAATQHYGEGFRRELGLSGGWYDTVGNLYSYYAESLLRVGVDATADAPETQVGAVRCASFLWNPDGLVLTAVTNALGVMTGLSGPKAGQATPIDETWRDHASPTNTVNFDMRLSRPTGVFKGSFCAWFDCGSTETNKTIAFEGALTPERANMNDGVAGRGFFLWPDTGTYRTSPSRQASHGFNWSYDLRILLTGADL